MGHPGALVKLAVAGGATTTTESRPVLQSFGMNAVKEILASEMNGDPSRHHTPAGLASLTKAGLNRPEGRTLVRVESIVSDRPVEALSLEKSQGPDELFLGKQNELHTRLAQEGRLDVLSPSFSDHVAFLPYRNLGKQVSQGALGVAAQRIQQWNVVTGQWRGVLAGGGLPRGGPQAEPWGVSEEARKQFRSQSEGLLHEVLRGVASGLGQLSVVATVLDRGRTILGEGWSRGVATQLPTVAAQPIQTWLGGFGKPPGLTTTLNLAIPEATIGRLPERIIASDLVSERLEQAKTFFETYGGSGGFASDFGYGQAVIDFMNWEIQSGRIPTSPYWDFVNKQMIQDMFDAQYADQMGLADGESPEANLWLAFIRNPNPDTFWVAHSASLLAAHCTVEGQQLFAQESAREQRFINREVVPNAVKVGPWFLSAAKLEARTDGMDPGAVAGMHTAKALADWISDPSSGAVRWFVKFLYPSDYAEGEVTH